VLELQSRRLCDLVMRHPRWKAARTVLLYHSLPDEVNTLMLLEHAVREDKTVLLPVVVGDELELRPYCQPQIGARPPFGVGDNLQRGAFGIMEPVQEGEPITDYASVDLVIVPGMAFDNEGHRLGRGKGFYDKLFATFAKVDAQPYKMGLCYDFQFVECVPNEQHDVKMEEVISFTI